MDNDNVVDNETVAKLFVSFREDTRASLSLHRQHFGQFVSIVLAVMAVSLTAFFKLRTEGGMLLVVMFGPILSVLLSFVATRACYRFYRRFLEHQSISTKLYYILDANMGISSSAGNLPDVFPGDSHLFPGRWLRSLKGCNTIDEFVNSHARRAANRLMQGTLYLLMGASAVIAVAILITAIWNIKCTGW